MSAKRENGSEQKLRACDALRAGRPQSLKIAALLAQ